MCHWDAYHMHMLVIIFVFTCVLINFYSLVVRLGSMFNLSVHAMSNDDIIALFLKQNKSTNINKHSSPFRSPLLFHFSFERICGSVFLSHLCVLICFFFVRVLFHTVFVHLHTCIIYEIYHWFTTWVQTVSTTVECMCVCECCQAGGFFFFCLLKVVIFLYGT